MILIPCGAPIYDLLAPTMTSCGTLLRRLAGTIQETGATSLDFMCWWLLGTGGRGSSCLFSADNGMF